MGSYFQHLIAVMVLLSGYPTISSIADWSLAKTSLLLPNDQSDLSGNSYWLYTRSNPTSPQIITYGDADSAINSHYNSSHQLVMIVHGWLNDGHHEVNTMITASYLKVMDANIIVVDWATAAALPYPASAAGVAVVGKGIGKFIDFLLKSAGGSVDNTHLIGWSLGAHAVGIASRGLDQVVARITGLDTAGPLWEVNPLSLKPSDAAYVEAIHTNCNGLGIGRTVGHADFYPNGGTIMPGCLTCDCNHQRSYKFFASSIESDCFVGHQCDSLLEAVGNLCNGTSTLNMGNTHLSKSGSGIYCLSTDDDWPYCINIKE